jgi:hypothetical protein
MICVARTQRIERVEEPSRTELLCTPHDNHLAHSDPEESRRDSGSIPEVSRGAHQGDPDSFGIKSGSWLVSSLDFWIKKKYFLARRSQVAKVYQFPTVGLG